MFIDAEGLVCAASSNKIWLLQVDYIFWTGDFPSHGDWFQNKSTQLTSVQTLADFLHEYFPNVPVYSALGNHEANPVDR